MKTKLFIKRMVRDLAYSIPLLLASTEAWAINTGGLGAMATTADTQARMVWPIIGDGSMIVGSLGVIGAIYMFVKGKTHRNHGVINPLTMLIASVGMISWPVLTGNISMTFLGQDTSNNLQSGAGSIP